MFYGRRHGGIMLKLAKECNLCVTAGSDYHGTNKRIKIGDTNDVQPELMKTFYEMVGLI